jgi:hypothetical protein
MCLNTRGASIKSFTPSLAILRRLYLSPSFETYYSRCHILYVSYLASHPVVKREYE